MLLSYLCLLIPSPPPQSPPLSFHPISCLLACSLLLHILIRSLCRRRMSDRPSRHQRRASQTVFALPESLSSFEAPPMEAAEKKAAEKQGQPSSVAADPSPPSSTLAGQELKDGVPKKH